MIEILPESHGNMLAIRGSGKLTDKDYKEILIPRFESLFNEYPKLRLLFEMDEDFQGWDSDAAVTYAKYGFKNRDGFEKVAAVCGPKWMNWGLKLQSLFTSASVRTFSCDRQADARQWLEADSRAAGPGDVPTKDQCC